MTGTAQQYLLATFPLFFVTLWLAVTTILAVLSGWYRLAARFPDQTAELPLLQFRGQSGSMGLGVNMRGVLRLGICPSGLRVGIMRIFGPFSRDFFVAWNDIAVTRKRVLFWPVARLQFGSPAIGSLTIEAHVADRLARAAGARWPEVGSFPAEQHRHTLRRLLIEWAAVTAFAALFFTLVPLIMAPANGRPPIVVAILFPAIVFGVVAIVRYVRERS